jgi:hypothetical protein
MPRTAHRVETGASRTLPSRSIATPAKSPDPSVIAVLLLGFVSSSPTAITAPASRKVVTDRGLVARVFRRLPSHGLGLRPVSEVGIRSPRSRPTPSLRRPSAPTTARARRRCRSRRAPSSPAPARQQRASPSAPAPAHRPAKVADPNARWIASTAAAQPRGEEKTTKNPSPAVPISRPP